MGAPSLYLAAAAVVVTATVVVAAAQRAAAVAEQEDQDDDPADVTTTETVVTHNKLPPGKFLAVEPLIPRYSPDEKRCVREECKNRRVDSRGGVTYCQSPFAGYLP